MSTQGVVAVGTLEKWTGVLNYWDSRPATLGLDLYQRIKAQSKSLREIGNDILKAGRWEIYIGDPLTADGRLRKPELITSEKPNPLFNQLIYILHPDEHVIHVLGSRAFKWAAPPKGSKIAIESEGIIVDGEKRLDNGRWHYGHCIFGHVHVGDLKFNEEPDFEALDEKWAKLGEKLSLWHVYGFQKSSFFKKLLKSSASQFIKAAKSLGFEPSDLGKTITAARDGSGVEYEIIGLADEFRNQKLLDLHPSADQIWQMIIDNDEEDLSDIVFVPVPAVLGREKSGRVRYLEIDAVLAALGHQNEVQSKPTTPKPAEAA